MDKPGFNPGGHPAQWRSLYESALTQLSHNLVHKTPAPVLMRLKRPHYRMVCGMEVLSRMFIFGGIAAAYMTADEAST
jgi:hypothetical protein